MKKEKSPSFYTGKGYLKVGKYAYRPLYREIAALLPDPHELPTIVDLGCGIGYFAEFLYKFGYRDYIGIDFSKRVLNLARKNAPDFEYILLNLYDDGLKDIVEKYRIFTMIETLEHISDDFLVLKSLPTGSTIIGSVPESNAAGHVRIFKGPSDVCSRYSSMIRFDFLKTIHINKKKPENVITVFRGTII